MSDGVSIFVSVMADATLRALVRLLDEEEKNMPVIEAHLLKAGSAAMPFLEEALSSPTPVVQRRARRLVQQLRFGQLKQDTHRFAALGDWEMDLEKGAFLVASYAYPDVDPVVYRRELDRIAADIAEGLDDEMYMQDVIGVINEVLFDDEGFRPDNRRFYDPENSYVNRVMDRRLGIPISLSLIYLLVAQRLSLPISGVALPGHFLVRYDGPAETIWIDPYNDGSILAREDCEQLLKAMGYPLDDGYLRSCTNRQIVARMFNNLAQAFTRDGAADKAGEVRLLADMLMRNHDVRDYDD